MSINRLTYNADGTTSWVHVDKKNYADCEKGQTAAKSGCTPASGDGGDGSEKKPAKKKASKKQVRSKAFEIMDKIKESSQAPGGERFVKRIVSLQDDAVLKAIAEEPGAPGDARIAAVAEIKKRAGT